MNTESISTESSFIDPNINLEDKIYRYMTFEKFVYLTENSKLFIPKCTSLDDPYEGLVLMANQIRLTQFYTYISKIEQPVEKLYSIVNQLPSLSRAKAKNFLEQKYPQLITKALNLWVMFKKKFEDNTDEEFKKIRTAADLIVNRAKYRDEWAKSAEIKDLLSLLHDSPDYESLRDKYRDRLPSLSDFEKLLLIAPYHTYVTCWTHTNENRSTNISQESDGLWRAYAPNRNGVRIQTNIRKLKDLLSKAYDEPEEKKSWNTIISFAYVEYFDELPSDMKYFESVFEHVYDLHRNFFSKRNAFSYENEFRGVILLSDGEKVWFNNSNGITYNIEDTSDFIEEVVVDPRAGDIFVATVSAYCENKKLNFDKSNLYRFDWDQSYFPNPDKINKDIASAIVDISKII